MSRTTIVWEAPEALYNEILNVQRELAFPQLVDVVTQAVQRYLADIQRENWQQEFRAFQRQVRADGGFNLGTTKEEIIAHLRQQRQEIFETDYAHLYGQ